MIDSEKIRHGLFFLHLILEKIIKSHVSLSTRDIPPRIHNLVRLAELSGIDFQQERIEFLAEMNPYNIEGRYPEMWSVLPSRQEADILIQKTKEILVWLKNQLLHPQKDI